MCFRFTANDLLQHSLYDNFSSGKEIAVAYFRAGYSPDSYQSEKVRLF